MSDFNFPEIPFSNSLNAYLPQFTGKSDASSPASGAASNLSGDQVQGASSRATNGYPPDLQTQLSDIGASHAPNYVHPSVVSSIADFVNQYPGYGGGNSGSGLSA